MKTKSRRSRTLLISGITAIATAVLPAASRAADYYLQSDQGSGWNWHNVGGTGPGWYTASSGGTLLTGAMDVDGIYHTNGHRVRTRELSTGTDEFQGKTLVIDGAGSIFTLKTSNVAATASVGHLIVANNASFEAGTGLTGGASQNLSIGTFEQNATSTFLSNTANRGFNLSIGSLSGSGDIVFQSHTDGTTRFHLNVADASAFTGSFNLGGGTLLFSNDLTTAGSLSLAAGTTVDFGEKSVTVSSLTIAGATYGAGATITEQLLADAGITVNNFGSITIVTGNIPEPAHATLSLLLGAMVVALAFRRRQP